MVTDLQTTPLQIRPQLLLKTFTTFSFGRSYSEKILVLTSVLPLPELSPDYLGVLRRFAMA